MRLLRFLTASGFRITLLIAGLIFTYHVTSELRVFYGAPPDLLRRLEWTALDAKIAARGPRPPERWRVAIAAADEKALQQLGPLPWDRRTHARLIRRLGELGAGAIAFDMTFDRPSTDLGASRSEELEQVFERTGFRRVPERLDVAAASVERAAADLGRIRGKKPKGLPEVPPLVRAASEARAAKSSVEAFTGGLEAILATAKEDPDGDLIAAVRESGRVVLGVLTLSKVEAEALNLGPEELRRALSAVRSSTISELVAPGEGGVETVLEGREHFERGLYRRYFGVTAPFDELAAATPHFGTLNAVPDADGVYRRISLVSGVKGTGVLLPTLALKAVEVALAAEPIQVLGAADDPSPRAVSLGGRRLELELQSSRALDWYGQFSAGEMPIFSVSDILAGAVEQRDIEGRAIFVAATAAGTHDQRVTPLDPAVPGVYIHATLAQNVFDGRHLLRPRHIVVIELLLCLFIGVVSGLALPRVGVIGKVLTAGLLAGAWVALDRFVLFELGLVVHTVVPVIQIFLSLLAVALYRFLVEKREREKTRQAFGHYLAPAVMEQVLSDPEQYLKLGGRRYEATVLFSDIRGFTTISEKLSPEELGALLNRYMTPMTNIVFEFGGTLDKYIGDAVMAFWGAPIEQPDHALRACRAALKMMASIEGLNAAFEAAGLPEIAIGIGLSSGPMTIGNMGSNDHLAYTALGDRVNLGSRLEGQTKDYGVDIIISDATYQEVKSVMLCRELGALRVKGKYEPVRIYQLLGEAAELSGKRAFVETFHEGLAAYRARRWDEAVESFTRARALSGVSGDKCSDQYIVSSMHFKEHPPPPDWDGVRVAESK